ncbi:GNAT family N-acetyltransferase [Paenibacillus abyssi]|uniref:Acetyltransferase n=1 Tax=Paenibacillus abyssi TaxID=1340531 RepID=A0A917CK88_9BACL|nr:GNAT family N-acetyltransferase [Paenibacillus abyssi]GGF91459.1 acetyltransferase [Paenibacillus abyssi]
MNAIPFLNGSRLFLRPLQENDAESNYLNWFNDAEVCKQNNHYRYPYLYQDALQYIQYAQKTKESLILAIVTLEDHVHIGNISLQDIHFINRTADFAIVLGEKKYWNKGYASEAAKLIIAHGFQELNLNRISCGTYHTNVGMQRLAESLGFIKEGVRRQAAYKQNQYIDVIEYGILRNEWLIRNAAYVPEGERNNE